MALVTYSSFKLKTSLAIINIIMMRLLDWPDQAIVQSVNDQAFSVLVKIISQFDKKLKYIIRLF